MARRKQAPKDLTGIRQRGGTYQVRAAKRWGWITVNPLDAAQRPRMPTPQPDPPSVEEAAKIANAACAQDADWSTFVWLTFITGARRGELVGLAWEHLDLGSSLLTIRRSLVRRNGKTILKDTKTHQMRRCRHHPRALCASPPHGVRGRS
ncbi:MAG: hypothetical protein ACT4NY_23030 [Pseudonocardiales bacterium]